MYTDFNVIPCNVQGFVVSLSLYQLLLFLGEYTLNKAYHTPYLILSYKSTVHTEYYKVSVRITNV